jgi:predicted acylesterase/phospholipase RssA
MKSFAILFIVFVALLSLLPASNARKNSKRGAPVQQCHALALSGGGALGAYEAGVLYGLIHGLEQGEAEWDVVTGISAGAIVTYGTSLFAVGDELSLATWLDDVVANLTTKNVFTHWSLDWPLGLLHGLEHESGLVNTEPLRETLTKFYREQGPHKDRKFVIGATSMKTGTLTTWDESVSGAQLINASMSSSAIPGVFPTQTWFGDTFQDGGVIEGVNVLDAVRRCFEVTSDPSQITVDVVMTSGRDIKPVDDPATFKTIASVERTLAIMEFNLGMRNVELAQQTFPQVNWRFNIYPSVPLPGALNFSHKALQEMWKAGITDANTAIKNQ